MNSARSIFQLRLFFRQFRQNFFHIGSIIPSSPVLGRAASAYLAQKQGQVQVLEVGAGTGAFTQEIVPLLESGDSFDIVEINSELITYLQQRFQQEPRFQTKGVQFNFFTADIRLVPFTHQYDYIIFSLPLTNFPPTMVQEILDLMLDRLKPGGVFSYIKYIFIGHFKYWFGSPSVKAEMHANQQIINHFTNQYQFERRAVLRNVLPAWTYYWRKPFG